MSTNRDFERITGAWLTEGPTELADRVLDAALDEVHLTNQRRRRTVLWRIDTMSMPIRLAAGIAVIAVVGYAGIALLNPAPIGPGSQPSPTPSPAGSVAPGIAAWTTYTSEAYSALTIGYPEDWTMHAAASRRWQPGDHFGLDDFPFAESFVSPGEDTIGLFVWEMPAGEGLDVETVDGLKAWAQSFCDDVIAANCGTFTSRAETMCLSAGGDSCRGAILVPTPEHQYAFFVNWGTAILSSPRVRVVVVAREDSFPSAARYGGSVALLKSILTMMDVRTP